METVTIPKSEYIRLNKISEIYNRFAETVFENIIDDPIDEVVKEFRETDIYTSEFIKDLEAGLKKSSLIME
jgi:hypothetical protein